MKWLFYKKETDTRAKIVLIYNMKPPKELLDSGNYIIIENIPNPEQIKGKNALPYCNPETEEFWYEHIDKPKSPRDIQRELNAKLLKDSASMQIELNNQKELNSSLLLKIAELEGKLNV